MRTYAYDLCKNILEGHVSQMTDHAGICLQEIDIDMEMRS